MKRIATAALALTLLGGTSALAADHDHGDNGSHDQGEHHQDHNTGSQHTSTPNNGTHTFTGHPQGGPQTGTPQTFSPKGAPNGFTPQGRHFNGPDVVNGPDAHDRGDWRGHDEGRDQGDWRSRDHDFGGPAGHPGSQRPRFNPQFFPRVVHPEGRFHWRFGRWFGPPGFFYRPWFYGEFLPYGWYASDYYIEDYWDYDLPVPPWGYEWIRNGPDALLVNTANGMVVEDVQGIFY